MNRPSSPFTLLSLGQDFGDASFDALYPDAIRKLSERFWTPVAVAKQAAAFLVARKGDQVLDVGSGVGKFSLIGSAVTAGVFHGIEQRQDLVDLANNLAQSTEARPTFHHGNVVEADWSPFQGIYLYNPFFELTAGPWCQIDATLGHSRERQAHYVQAVVGKLANLQPGTRVATYFGFGGKMPGGFSLVTQHSEHPGPLALWVRN